MTTYTEFHARECHTTTRYEAPACLAALSRTIREKRINDTTFLACMELVELMETWKPVYA